MVLNLKVLLGRNGLTVDLSSCGLRIDQGNVWSLYIVRKLDGFIKNVYVLRLLQVEQKKPDDELNDKWGGRMVEVEKINSRRIPHSIQ